jgi:hypothetical protein
VVFPQAEIFIRFIDPKKAAEKIVAVERVLVSSFFVLCHNGNNLHP